MALKPVLKLKVDELFLRWLSNPDTQQLLITNLRQIQSGEPLTYFPQAINSYGSSSKTNKGISPRIRPGSPSTPPCSPSMASPRSPRRLLSNKFNRSQNSKLSLHKDRDGHQLPNNADSLPKRGDPDGQSDTFLRQKEAQLREKREREKEKKDPKEWQINNSSNSNNKNSLTVLSKEENSNSSNINKTNSHHSDINTNGNVVKTSKSQPHLHKLRTASSTNGTHSSSSPTKLSKGDTDSAHGRKSASAIAEQYKNVHIPQFYFPKGHPGDGLGGRSNTEDVLNKIKEAYAKIEGGKATKENLGPVTKACGLPSYMKSVMFKQFGGEKHGHLTLQQFLAQWRKLCNTCLDDASQFVNLLAKPGVTFLLDEDFVTLVQDVVEGHPGLTFLQEAPEFHSRYVQTVISRILYCVNRSWTGKITVQELRRSNLIQTLRLLDEEEDINQITDFFSYEHFYVIYCKFWELDKDHDLFISPEDLGRHNDHAISSKMIERIFSGAVTRNLKEGKMSYKDFVWFLISEEDKRNPTSIEYWFRCMDLDGDGVISMYEMNYFYKEQVDKMEQLGIETLPFEDTLCQMLDMIKPAVKNRITLGDLKACKLTPIFFDTFFNLDKYLEHEQKDPFANARDLEDGEPEMSDWERYAADEYELLVAEEGANENVDELVYEDDFEAEEDEIPANSGPGQEPAVGDGFTTNTKHQARPNAPSPDEDIYDFTPKDLGY